MLFSELERIAEEKAKRIGVDFKRAKAERYDSIKHERSGNVLVGGRMYVSMQNGNIVLEINNVGDVPRDKLEIMVEHEVCHCKDNQEGLYGREVASSENPFAQVIAAEMYNTFIEYFAAQRQIREFGQLRFDQCQLFDLKEFVKSVNGAIHDVLDIGEREQAGQCIFSYFKEQIKCGLMSRDPGIIPPVISQIIAPLPHIFEAMADLNIPWIEKTKINYFLGVHISTNVHLIQSFLDGELLLYGPDTVWASDKVGKAMGASRVTRRVARAFEFYLRASHAALARKEALPSLDAFYRKPLRFIIGDYIKSVRYR